MDLVSFIGQGICHRDPSRVVHPEAWLCGRCTALYAAALVGVALSGAFGRRLRLGWQLALAALLVAPVGLEKALIAQGSPLDTVTTRLVTGALGGLGVALFVGARARGAVRWPEGPWAAGRVPKRALVSLALAVAAAGALALALGAPAPLDLVAFAGVVAIAAAGTAWALDVAAAIASRLGGRPAGSSRPRWGLPLLLALAAAELVLLAAAPPSWRPGFAWIEHWFARPY